MSRFIGTIYMESDDKTLTLSNNNLAVKEADISLPLKDISALVIRGRTTLSSEILMACINCGVTITFLDGYGNYRNTIHPDIKGNVITRYKQIVKSSDIEKRKVIALSIYKGKITNQLNTIKKFVYNHGSTLNTDKAIIMISNEKDVNNSIDHQAILGKEGLCAKYYFNCFPDMILNDEFEFNGRQYHPCIDEVNALLSYGYGLLRHDLEKYIQMSGLDPYVAFLHSERTGRMSLALDLMEEFRPWIIDRMVLDIINRHQVTKTQFTVNNEKEIYCGGGIRKILIDLYEKKKASKINGQTVNDIIKHQVMHFARVIRDEDAEYKSFIYR